MELEWNKIHKIEENIENYITEIVEEKILDSFQLDSLEDADVEVFDSIVQFRATKLNEYSTLYK